MFFPVESLPAVLRWLAYASPLWHGVDLCRAATLGVAPEWSVTGHLAYLALWAAAGCWLALPGIPSQADRVAEASWSRSCCPGW